MSASYRFGRFEVRPAERQLLRDGQPLHVGARALDLLLALIERRDRLVTKGELLDLVWPGLVVEEANIQVQVSGLRRLLGPDAIATVPGLGYRLAMVPEPDSLSPADRPAGLPHDASSPAMAPAAQARPRSTNLPAATDGLVGREPDIVALTEWLASHRLVTVLGPGGIGKTRVAQEAARHQLGRHANGVWWVDLAALSSADHLVAAIANAANLQLGDGSGEPLDLLLGALAARESLLVLDNCEHLAGDVGRIVQAMRHAAPGVRLLVTSQESLHVAGEQVYRLEPLAVPPADAALDAARSFSAVQLLEQRARSADRRFALDGSNVGAAIELLHRLDGVPLAIEMAAARIPLLGLAALGDHLAKWSRLLRSTSRSAPPRHQTLQATLEWSHSLLDAREQSVLRRLAAFAGSFRVEPALQAVAVDGLDHWDVLDVLTALVDKSLVQVERLEPPRYRLLETMRMFAAEQLAQHDETAQALQRHGEAMASLAEQVERAFWETADRPWLARHAPDYDDLQVAFDRACQRQDAEVAARTGSALLRLDHLRNINAPRRARAEALYRLVPNASLHARAWIWSCIASHGLIALDVVSRLEASGHAVAAWRQLGDRARLHFALGFHAAECARAHDFEAADRALAEARALEDADWPLRRRMWGASALAGVCIHRGDAAGYREASRIELALAERAGAERAAAWARLKLADAALMAGDHDEAIELGRLAVAELHELDQPSNLGLALSNLCAALLLSGNDEPAREAAAQALPLTWRSGWGYLVLDSLALLAARDGRAEPAAQLLGHVDAWYAAHGDERQPNEAQLARRAAEAIEAVIGAQQAATLRAAGSALTEAEAEALAGAVLRRADPADSGRPPRSPR